MQKSSEATGSRWETTFCRLCEPMCGLRVEVQGKRVLKIKGDPEHPLSRGWICRRGAAFAEVHNDPDRLCYPLRKGQGGELERISWDQAYGEVGDRLSRIRRDHGPDAVAIYMGNPMAFCTYGAMSIPVFAKTLGTSQYFTSGSQDCNNKFAASQRVLGSPVLQPVPDMDNVRYLLILGANPVVSGMSFVQVPRPMKTLKSIRSRGGEVVVVDPRRTETARIASEHLFIQPDTDAFFLLSLLWVIIEKGLMDHRWVEEDPRGFAELEEIVRHWPPERTEAITGIPREKTKEIALRLAGPEPAACYGSIGINLGRSGTLTYWLILVLNLLSGHFDRKGGSLLCRGLMDVNRLYRLSGVGKGTRRSALGDFLPLMGTYPAALMARGILGEQKPRIRALVVVAGNPLLSVPNEGRLKKALESLDLLVSLDIYQNETGAFAHYLLPATDFLEREDLNLSHAGLQFRPYAAFTPAVVEPDGQQRPEEEILETIAKRMGLSLWDRSTRAVTGMIARIPRAGSARGASHPGSAADSRPGAGTGRPDSMPRQIVQAALRVLGQEDFATVAAASRGILLKPHQLGRFREKSRWPWKRRKVYLAPPDLVREAWKLEGFKDIRRNEKGDFLLIGKRERHTHNTWMHNAEGLARGEKTNYLYIHPEDGAAKGISQGDLVIVRGPGEERIEVPCRFTPDLKRGVVALPHGWGHRYPIRWSKAVKRPGVNVNRLLSDSVLKLEPISGVAWMNGIPVDIEPAEG